MTTLQKGLARTEYGTLREVLMCQPKEMRIKKVINEVQKSYIDENIDKKKAMEEHGYLMESLKAHGVTVHLLPVDNQLPEQVFTRDLGFATDKGIILGKLESEIRRPETDVCVKWLEEHQWGYQPVEKGTVEGGDVLMDEDCLFIGKSNRTSDEAIDYLKRLFPDKKTITIPVEPQYLHLDCIMNILSPGTALLYPEALPRDIVQEITMRYRTIFVDKEEQFQLGTNVLSIGHKKVISMPENERVNHKLETLGFEIVEVPFSEIIKSGGAFRCVTMPLVREE